MNSKRLSAQYLYEAHLAFTNVGNGIYRVGKDKPHYFGPGKYVSKEDVIKQLNSDSRVVLCEGTLEYITHANFSLQKAELTSKDIKNSTMKGVLDDA